MKIEQRRWTSDSGWEITTNRDGLSKADLVLAFGCKEKLVDTNKFQEIKDLYPEAEVAICSTAGEVLSDSISDGTISLVALEFNNVKVKTNCVQIPNFEDSYAAGKALMSGLEKEDLSYVLVISDGTMVNGSDLTRALRESVDENQTIVTGGLAGDGPNFQSTLVGLNEEPAGGNIIAIGLYGANLRIGHAAQGGWDAFGPERTITRSKDNILYEIDGKSALSLYKTYLGEFAEELPGSALLFPLGMKENENSETIVRTILGVDEENDSMIFAGNVPEGATVRMMKSNFERLMDGAKLAADGCLKSFGSFEPELALVVSCAGRKFVLNERAGEELKRVRETMGENTIISGFYAYGEISPVVESAKCELHNQTMTITTLSEIDG